MDTSSPPPAPEPADRRSPSVRHDDLADDLAVRPVWSAFEYSLGAQNDAARAALRRDLKDLHAVSVKQGSWAVPCPVEDIERLDELVQRVSAAGGQAALTDVGFDTPGELEAQARLNRASDRLWEDLASTADLLFPPHAAESAPSDAERIEALGTLRSLFALALADDFVRSDVGALAATRLDRFAAPLADQDPPRARRLDIEMVSSWRLRGGDAAWVAMLVPTPDPRWDLAFSRFEAFAYRPSDERVPLRHGTFRWVCPRDRVDEAIDALYQRVRRFGQAHG